MLLYPEPRRWRKALKRVLPLVLFIAALWLAFVDPRALRAVTQKDAAPLALAAEEMHCTRWQTGFYALDACVLGDIVCVVYPGKGLSCFQGEVE